LTGVRNIFLPSDELIETLAKVIIAAAWADEELAPEEVDSLKDILFRYYSKFAAS
jgi:hypothetical protein